jgi:hypothetical protein
VWVVRRADLDLSELMRALGGLLLAAGATVLLLRKSGHGGWSDFARVIVVLVPAAVLYGLALEPPPQERARPWQSVLAVTSILLVPVVLFECLHWIGASTRHLLYDAAVFALTGALAAHAARRARVAYAGLLAALALLIAWLLVWGKIVDHPSANTFRWLLVAAAAVLLLAAARMARAGVPAGGDVAIAGGLAAVAAGVLGVIIGAFVALARLITTGLTGSVVTSSGGSITRSHVGEPLVSGAPISLHTSGAQHLGWDVYLLLASLALVWIGSRLRVRGLGYVGGAGLIAFVISVGVQITRLEAGRSASHALAGWPLALLIIGVLALVLSAAGAER